MGGYARSTSKWSKPQLGEVIFIYCNTSKHRVTNAEAFREHGKRCRARAENHGPARDGLGVKAPLRAVGGQEKDRNAYCSVPSKRARSRHGPYGVCMRVGRAPELADA